MSIAEAPVQPTVEHLHHVPANGPTENGMLSNDRLQQHLQQHQRTTGPVLLTFPFTMHQLLALKATTWAGSMDKAAELLGVTKVRPQHKPASACQAPFARCVLTLKTLPGLPDCSNLFASRSLLPAPCATPPCQVPV